MSFIKIILLYIFLIYKAKAQIMEKDESQDMLAVPITPLPIEVAQWVAEGNAGISADQQLLFANNANDIEVFEEKFGSENEKQEAEEEVSTPAEGEEDTPLEAEEPKGEDMTTATAESEAASTADEIKETQTQPETEAEPEVAPEPAAEEPKEEELPAELEVEEQSEHEPELEPEKDGVQPADVSPSPEAYQENDESEMSNDEPAKEEDKVEVAKTLTVTPALKDGNKNETYCFACTSAEDLQCRLKAKQKVLCPKVNAGDAGKHNGCYILYKVDTNTTMRGCVDELTEDDLKYCLTNENLCNLCYSNGCNDKGATSSAIQIKSNIFSILVLTISLKIITKTSSFTHSK